MYKSPHQCVKTDIVQMRLPFTLNECDGIACDDCYFKGIMQGTYCIVMRKILTLDKVKKPYMVSFAEDDMLECMTKNMFIDSIPDDIDSFFKSLIGKSGGKHVVLDDD